MDAILNLTDADFDASAADGITVVDFWAGWCGTLVSAVPAARVSRWFLLQTAFVGVNQRLCVTEGACPASVVLRRACHLQPATGDARGHIGEAKGW
jgi:thiol-disulfide isomerase/thioredoxin